MDVYEAIDPVTPRHYAGKLLYLSCPSTIRQRVLEMFDSAPSIDEIKSMQEAHRSFTHIEGHHCKDYEPDPTPDYAPRGLIRERPPAPPEFGKVNFAAIPEGLIQDRVLFAVAEAFSTSVRELVSLSRVNKLVQARFVAARLLRDIKKPDGQHRFTLPGIARVMGRKSHEAAEYSLKRFEIERIRDPKIERVYQTLREGLGL